MPEIRHTPVGKKLENRIRAYETDGVFRVPLSQSLNSSVNTQDSSANGMYSSSAGDTSTGLSSPEHLGIAKSLRMSSSTPVPTQITKVKGSGEVDGEGNNSKERLEELIL